MATSFSHSATLPCDLATLYATYSSEDFWHDRVASVGGPEDSLDSFAIDEDGITVTVTQEIPLEEVPDIARKFLPSGLKIVRTTIYDAPDEERLTGSAHAEAVGGLGTINGSGESVMIDADSCTESISGKVSIAIPLMGKKFERLAAAYLEQLFTAEYNHLDGWLRG